MSSGTPGGIFHYTPGGIRGRTRATPPTGGQPLPGAEVLITADDAQAGKLNPERSNSDVSREKLPEYWPIAPGR